jgi:hypothetical protein
MELTNASFTFLKNGNTFVATANNQFGKWFWLVTENGRPIGSSIFQPGDMKFLTKANSKMIINQAIEIEKNKMHTY